MNLRNSIFIILLALMLSQCEDSLKENFYSGTDIETLVSTPNGLENLVTACYVSNKMWYGKEYGWDLTTNGTDLWTYAGDADQMVVMSSYSPSFNNQYPSRLGVVWAELYKALNTCNTALYYIPLADIDEDLKTTRTAEVSFLRALYLWKIVETWGNVHFSTERITSPELSMERSSVKDFYTQIFKDLDYAVENLDETLSASDYGRVHKYAALALRARTHLYWASEYMTAGNSFDGVTYDAINGTNHNQQAILDAQAVIDGGYKLYDKYSDVWLMENNASADGNTESIWAINYSQSEYALLNVDPDEYDNILGGSDPKPFDEREGGNDGHMMFGMRWFAVYTPSSVMVKDDGDDITATEPTRPFCRYMPTKYLIDLYDANIDQRFYGSFNNVFYSNNPDTAANDWPKWRKKEKSGEGILEELDPALVGKRVLEYGDTAFYIYKDEVIPGDQYYIKTGTGDWRIHKTRHHFFIDMSMIYDSEGNVLSSTSNNRRAYFDLSKWYDYTRPHNGENQDIVGSQRGQRDFIVFRLPEMYYIIAEANLGMNNKQGAYDALLTIADKRAIDGDGTAMMTAYGVAGPDDVDIDFILDDKGREMAGEQQRWFDLKRTGKTLERIRAHNPDAANIDKKHIIRPIPQVELDAIENKSDYITGYGIY